MLSGKMNSPGKGIPSSVGGLAEGFTLSSPVGKLHSCESTSLTAEDLAIAAAGAAPMGVRIQMAPASADTVQSV
jgi:hypothetical protein